MHKTIFKGAVFLLFSAIALFLYFPAAKAGLVYDFIDWTTIYFANGIHGFKQLFGDMGMHPLYHLIFFGIYKMAGLNWLVWFVIFLLLHVLNAFLSFKLFSRLFEKIQINNASQIALFGSILFLISPYQTEAVVWKATIHYLTATFCILLALVFLLKYLETPANKYLWAVYICQFVALFSLEIGFSIPLLSLIMFVWCNARREPIVKSVTKVFLPQAVVMGIYFVSTKFFFGKWIGHYGAATHLNFSVALLTAALNKYLLKFIFFFQFVKYERRMLLLSIYTLLL